MAAGQITHGIPPTPERVRHAGARGLETSDGINGVVVRRFVDAPVQRLARRGQLAPGDEDANALRLAAAERYRSDWFRGQMDGLRAGSLEPPVSRETCDPAHLWSPSIVHARDRLRQARVAITSERTRRVVDLIVGDEREVEDVGHVVTGRADREQARAVVIDRLQEGLAVLVRHYGLA